MLTDGVLPVAPATEEEVRPLRWLIPGRVAAADDASELHAAIDTVLLLGRAAPCPAYGRSASGNFVVDRPLRRADRPALWEVQLVVDFLRYEHKVGRVVAIIAKPLSLADLCVECLTVADGTRKPSRPLAKRYVRALTREGERRIRRRGCSARGLLRKTLVHTAPMDAMPSILRDGALVSTASMTGGPTSIGAAIFREPDDYAEYVMFSSPGGFRGGISGEIVVNSRRIGEFWSYERAREGDYVPGVRMYFSRLRLEDHPAVCFDGVHGLKIRLRLDLAGNLLAVATGDASTAERCRSLRVPVLQSTARTPEEYVAESDRLFVASLGRI
jgi:hypothetical protein